MGSLAYVAKANRYGRGICLTGNFPNSTLMHYSRRKPHVRVWHEADVPLAANNVGLWLHSGLSASDPIAYIGRVDEFAP
jgi:hypothetical protein